MTLRRGDHGPAVADLQRKLNTAADVGLDVDGVYGEETEQAVRVVQFAYHLTRDGIAGPETMRALAIDWPAIRPTLAPIPAGWLLGVDTSDAQGTVDGGALARASVSFAWIKVSDGEHDGQTRAADTAKSCQDNGIAVGFYGVLEPYGVARVAPQVANFVRRVKATGVTPDLPGACDFELAAGQSGTTALTSAATWCEDVEAEMGARPILYTGPAFIATLERFAGPSAAPPLPRLVRFPLWIAHYGPALDRGPTVPAPWRDWTIWQASGDHGATLPGTTRAVDVDYFRGTIEDLRALGRTAP